MVRQMLYSIAVVAFVALMASSAAAQNQYVRAAPLLQPVFVLRW